MISLQIIKRVIFSKSGVSSKKERIVKYQIFSLIHSPLNERNILERTLGVKKHIQGIHLS